MAAVPIVTPVKFPPELIDFEGWHRNQTDPGYFGTSR